MASQQLVEVRAGPYTIRGVSVAGVYTSLHVPELGVVLDVGVPLRSFATVDRIFLSHAHADHAASLGALLSIRNLVGRGEAIVHLPSEIAAEMQSVLRQAAALHRAGLHLQLVPMDAGTEQPLTHDLHVRAFRTHHPVVSLGFQFLRRVQKLRPEHHGLAGSEIARRRKAGDATLLEATEHLELAYATDTLSRVLQTSPSILRSRVLVLECTYLDARHSIDDARRRAHIHLDELVALASAFENEHLVLMHFSQTHSPAEVHHVLRERLAPHLKPALHIFAPSEGGWFG